MRCVVRVYAFVENRKIVFYAFIVCVFKRTQVVGVVGIVSCGGKSDI